MSSDSAAAGGREPTEIEVKLSVSPPGPARRLIIEADPHRLAGFGPAGEPHVVTLIDRYIDTNQYDGRLAQALMRARVRQTGSAIVLTVKRAGSEDRGVTTRVELEGPATSFLDPHGWPASEARAALLAVANEYPLVEIARLRQRRLTRLLQRASTIVELSLDAIEALDHGHVVGRRYELEAELVEGEADALAELADALRGVDGVGPPLGSKLRFTLDAVLVR